MSTEILPHNIPALSQEARDSNSIRIPYSPLRFWRGYPSCEMMNNGLKRWKILLLLYTKEINKLWNCFLSSSGYSKMGKKANMVGFLKAINDADTDSQIAIFLQILAHCVMGFFSDYTMYDVHFSLQDTIQSWFCIRGKKIWKQCTYVQCRIHKWSVKLTMLLLFVLICRLINFLIS